ncbi:hypothetical protein HYPSUDRAFT_723422 [Hypholoma sublateritium FD-334 SS-4]|uniref:Uncharacterized protein n=1 Tax=Hypholoma sublateritium (strain FD-334 SS-4) TaxID=945553 RepID=A0A0D2PNP0_HYPSF|nr:hypothetical protein HYPSUDRAFT_723422 [Hypholoma sublateritium FD-334 SS-4]
MHQALRLHCPATSRRRIHRARSALPVSKRVICNGHTYASSSEPLPLANSFSPFFTTLRAHGASTYSSHSASTVPASALGRAWASSRRTLPTTCTRSSYSRTGSCALDAHALYARILTPTFRAFQYVRRLLDNLASTGSLTKSRRYPDAAHGLSTRPRRALCCWSRTWRRRGLMRRSLIHRQCSLLPVGPC